MVLCKDLCEDFRKLEINIVTRRNKPMLCAMEGQPILVEKIRIAQGTDWQLGKIKEEALGGKALGFIIHGDST